MWYCKIITGAAVFAGTVLLAGSIISAETTKQADSSKKSAVELYNQAIQCYENKEFEQAFALAGKSAAAGYLPASHILAMCYENGNGAAKNAAQAFLHYRACAEKGLSHSEYRLAGLYFKGEGTDEDPIQAFYWYKRAAEHGHSQAQFLTAMFYKNGIGTTKNQDLAIQWFQKSVQQGNSSAQAELGKCFKNGNGVEKDDEKAVQLYKKSAAQGNHYGQLYLACHYAENMNYNQAFELFKKSAEAGNAEALFHLGNCYFNGWGVNKDDTMATRYWNQASQKKDTQAMFRIAQSYITGEFNHRSYGIAVSFCFEAVRCGYAPAHFYIGLFYHFGSPFRANAKKAQKHLEIAAKQGYEPAQRALSLLGYK